LLALLGAHRILHVSSIRVKLKENLLLLLGIERRFVGHQARSLVTISTTLCRLLTSNSTRKNSGQTA